MNWFDQYKKDFGFKSNYQVSKKQVSQRVV